MQMNSMDEICVPVIKKILGHYLELKVHKGYEQESRFRTRDDHA